METITLQVDPKNLDTVLTILNNLKEDLIDKVHYEKQNKLIQETQYQPKVGSVIYEENSGTNDRNGKYASAAAYKARLKK